MSQQAQLKTTSVILKIDIINSPQQEANEATSSEPIKGGQKVKMTQLKLVHSLLASLVVLLVIGGIAYLALNGSTNQQQQPKQDSQIEQAQQATTVAQWSSASPDGSGSRLSSTGVALSSTVGDTKTMTTFGRSALDAQPGAATTIQEQATSHQQQRTTTSQQETSASAETSRMFGAPVAVLSTTTTTTTTTTTPDASTEQSRAAEPTVNQPVQIQDTKMSILLPDPSAETSPPTSSSSSPSPSPSAVETIPVQSVTPSSQGATSSSLSPTSSDPTTTQDPEQAWQEFKAMYRRQYPSQEEESRRKEIFLANARFIATHNERTDSTYRLGMNHFGDYTRDEINQIFIGPQISWSQTISHLQTPIPPPMKILSDVGEPQPQVDWRNITSGSPIDQSICHESSVFAAVASIEAALNARLSLIPPAPGSTWQPVKLAESQVLDCMRSVAPANAPPICLGYSSMLHVFDLLQRSPLGGIVSLAEYMDFISRNQQPMCDLPQATQQPATNLDEHVYPQQPRAKLSTFNVIHCDNIPEALVNSGPLVVALDASQSSFHFYKSGLYYDQNCSTETYNHHALLIGLQPLGHKLADDLRHNAVDSTPPAQYLVRNSLGLDWGEGGHMRLLKVEDNKCLPQMLAISPNLL